jgi:methylmalonyl-CoA/ethylmalonyl-CoA epimerase
MSSIAFDHIAIAVPDLAAGAAALEGTLGGRRVFGMPAGVYRFGQWRFDGGGRLELLEPLGPDGFLHRFLQQHGPGVHHVTFKVSSLREACDRARAHGYEIVGFDDSDPRWAEAFLHPKQAQGIVVQLAQSSGTGGARPPERPPAPPDAPAPVTILGLRLRAHSRERAETQWGAVLQGSAEPGADGALVYRWPRSPLRLVVEIEAAGPEGPLCIEYASARSNVTAARPHPALGAVFVQRPPGAPGVRP